MFSAGQYIEKRSFLHSLDPRTKLFLLLAFAGLVLIKACWWNNTAAIIIVIAGTSLSKIGLRCAFKMLWTFRFFLLITFMIHLLFTPGADGYDWKFFHISFAGVENGILFSIRIGLLMWAAALFGWITSPVSLGDALEKLFAFLRFLKISPRDVSMVVLLAMRFIPTMMDDAEKIRWAQLARGSTIEGGVFHKAQQIVPLVVPLFVSAFRRADKLALALELRGYNPKLPRTRIEELKMRFRDWITIAFSIIIMLIAIAGALDLIAPFQF